MEMTELTIDERMVLIGLVAKMIAADSKISSEEIAELEELADEMGMGSLQSAVEKARDRDLEEVLTFAEVVERQDARQLIHTVLVDLAAVDGVSEDEAALIARVEGLWDIQRPNS